LGQACLFEDYCVPLASSGDGDKKTGADVVPYHTGNFFIIMQVFDADRYPSHWILP
jgi:hypothetical protein